MDIERIKIALKHDTCEASEACQSCKGLRDEALAAIDHLQQICAAAYQLAGTVGAPVRFLDALALHDDVYVDALLPVSMHECDEIAALQARVDELMMEYCPEEMTQEQKDRWEAAQRRSDGA